MEITKVTLKDLPEIVRIENLGFTPEEAGTKEQYQDRIEKLQDTFLIARINEQVVGFVVGPAVKEKFVEDWMYENTPKNLPTGGNQIIFTIAVDPNFRGHSIGSKLLKAMENNARKAQRESISLTSLEKNLPFYLKNGFKNLGVADSEHAGETWYNLVKELND
ncbi:GNAT family N-acetyltransferase [Companilactobacillus pabuli]|jgi:ribosomal protein S18 acetylase RimI-like enzyme|uniref:GNAT family N-acetyltransferase n=1 Tax=Companilactobacillus pabuli TaxID=2714036 RepID=A0A7L7KZQ3_9LACO|nr:N-acetyltransferase [Companilactobacillus pabuli]AKP03040.1 GNAT family acetyltransferase [Companilactobacillus farciminis]AKS51340.1 GNAT family acetyltransferase [Companilactobacillus farciminis]MDG5112124.1 N-acetyltransferase [Companilactobacillus pabuli]QMT85235.1 GNAT family N-acetyltransferase [Companilactobacillus pabuli]GAQ00937.1 GNAT family acetyltransferase [Companilactobacillus farciminis]